MYKLAKMCAKIAVNTLIGGVKTEKHMFTIQNIEGSYENREMIEINLGGRSWVITGHDLTGVTIGAVLESMS